MANNFPKFNYHCSSYHSNKRELFNQYGTLGSVHFENIDGAYKVNPQFGVLLFDQVRLCSDSPSLPIHFNFSNRTTKYKNFITDNFSAERNKKLDFLKNAVHIIKHGGTRSEFMENMEKILNVLVNCLETSTNIKIFYNQFAKGVKKMKISNVESLLKSETFQKICSYINFFDEINLKKPFHIPVVNENFSGGCLSVFQMNKNEAKVVFPFGNEFNFLKSCQLNTKDFHVKLENIDDNIRKPEFIQLDNTILETAINKEFYAARCKNLCNIYSLQSNKHLFSSKYKEESTLTSISFHPFFDDEFIYTNDSGSISKVDISDNCEYIIYNYKKSQKSVEWYHSHFTSHPTTILQGSKLHIHLIDIRDGQAKTFFKNSHRVLLSENEKFRSFRKLKSSEFYHVIGTDNQLIFLDERFANEPVMCIHHVLRQAPQFLFDTNELYDGNNVLLAGNHLFSETQALHFSSKNSLQRIDLPWLICKPSNVFKYSSICNKSPFWEDVFKTIESSSLVGISCLQNENEGFMALQLTTNGDIFYQHYSPKENEIERTHSVSICGKEAKKLRENENKIIMDFIDDTMKRINEKLVDNHDETCITELDFTAERDFLKDLPKPHTLCAICLPALLNNDINEEIENCKERCSSCGNSIKFGYDLGTCVKKNLAPPKINQEYNKIDKLIITENEKIFTDPHSLIIEQLWLGKNDHDFIELLKQRASFEEELRKKEMSENEYEIYKTFFADHDVEIVNEETDTTTTTTTNNENSTTANNSNTSIIKTVETKHHRNTEDIANTGNFQLDVLHIETPENVSELTNRKKKRKKYQIGF